MSLHALTVHELHGKLKKREVSSVEITESVFQRISSTEEKLRCYITLCRDAAVQEAKRYIAVQLLLGAGNPLEYRFGDLHRGNLAPLEFSVQVVKG